MQLFFDAGWAVSRFFGSILMGAHVVGREHLPKEGAFILAPNHLSYFDPPLVGSFVPRRVHFFAKQELFETPFLGFIVRRVNVHPVKRGAFDRNAIRTAVETLKAGKPLTVFPEGTRGSRDKFLAPKPGIGMIARQAEVPIVPCYVEGTDTVWECILRKRRFHICYGPPISADWIRSLPSSKEAWLKIADEVMSRLTALRALVRGKEGGGTTTLSGDEFAAFDSQAEDSIEEVDTHAMALCVDGGVAEKRVRIEKKRSTNNKPLTNIMKRRLLFNMS